MNTLKLNLKRNLYTFIQENAFENVVWEVVVILSQPRCVKFKSREISVVHNTHFSR